MRTALLLLTIFLLAACIPTAATPSPQTPPTVATAAVLPTDSHESQLTPLPYIGLTHHSLDGNRLIAGSADLPNTQPLDIPLDGVPAWLVSAPTMEGSLWVAVLKDGRVQAFHVVANTYSPINLGQDSLPPGMPPILLADGETFTLLPDISEPSSSTTHPIPLSAHFDYAYIHSNGSLVLESPSQISTLEIDALPDARLLQDELGRLLFLSSPTTQYDHSIAGDAFEAASISLVDPTPPGNLIRRIPIPDGKVVEGIAPIWVDINDDGQREIIVTISDARGGAQILVLNENGEIVAAGDPIGQGYRWRHQIAVAPFGPNGELELVDVLTPHIGGVVEFFRFEGNRLVLVAEMPGYTSHVIGSRNMDMAAAGDFDGDGLVELLLPSQYLTSLALIQRQGESAVVEWEIELGVRLSTNLSAVRFPNGDIALGLGLENGVLRLWLP